MKIKTSLLSVVYLFFLANILKLGDNIDDFQGQRKNSAMTLVSQMLFEESPKRKKRCLSSKSPTPVCWKIMFYLIISILYLF